MVSKEVQEYVYKHSWEVVTRAHWAKYPNEKCPQVQKVDTLKRYIDTTSNELHTTRLFTGSSPIPSFLHWLIPPEPVYAMEKSVVNRETRSMQLDMRSLSFANILQVNERCIYREHPDNPDWTLFRQEWQCEWNVPKYLKSRLDALSLQRFRDSVQNGRQAVQEICTEIESKWDSAARDFRSVHS
mmetsp:Transcript_8328/g.15072  ORF Transcript_8328/g.15072 Transcript_8328/m.15072 type:complete len:185 (-) Transcript_8328:948-1502(-)